MQSCKKFDYIIITPPASNVARALYSSGRLKILILNVCSNSDIFQMKLLLRSRLYYLHIKYFPDEM